MILYCYSKTRKETAQLKKTNSLANVKNLTLLALMTALVAVFQCIGLIIPIGFNFGAFALVPIVIGAAIGGIKVGAWLGFVSGVAVLVSGDAASFLAISIGGTIAVVLLKGLASGVASALVYRIFENKNKYLAVIAAAIVCPVVNTGVFILGCFAFFMDTIRAWGSAMGFENAFAYIILGMIGINFIIELVLNIILSPTVIRLLAIKEKHI
jgi:uncharacterized membrane protein